MASTTEFSPYKPVIVKSVSVSENTYTDGGKVWTVANLIERSKDLPVFELPIQTIYIGAHIWSPIRSAKSLAKHMKRVMSASPDHPIILDEDGFIMDGWHRVTKALIDGVATVKAVRFDENPPHDYEVKEGE